MSFGDEKSFYFPYLPKLPALVKAAGLPVPEAMMNIEEQFEALLKAAMAHPEPTDGEELNALFNDPSFVAFASRIVAELKELAPTVWGERTIVSIWKGFLKHQQKLFQQIESNRDQDWKKMYKIISRCLIVDCKMPKSFTYSETTAHNSVFGDKTRPVSFASLNEALRNARPHDSIYVISSSESDTFGTAKRSTLKIPLITDEHVETLLNWQQNPSLSMGNFSSWGEYVDTLTFEYDKVPEKTRAGLENTIPIALIQIPNLTIFGGDPAEFSAYVNAVPSIDIPVIWMADGGKISTLDFCRGGLWITNNASLEMHDCHIEVPVSMYEGSSWRLSKSEVYDVRTDSFLRLPPSLNFELALEDTVFESPLHPVYQQLMYMKLFFEPISVLPHTPHIEYELRDVCNKISSKRQRQDSDHIKLANSERPTRRYYSLSPEVLKPLGQINLGFGVDYSKITFPALPSDDVSPESKEIQKFNFMSSLINFLEKPVVFQPADDTPSADPNIGDTIRTSLLGSIGRFPTDRKLVLLSLFGTRTIKDWNILEHVQTYHMDEMILPLIKRYLNDCDPICTCALALLAKISLASDILAERFGTNAEFWEYMTILCQKIMGVLPTSELELASGPDLRKSSESRRITRSRKATISIQKNESTANALLSLIWVMSSYPETGFFAAKFCLPFLKWCSQYFLTCENITTNVFGALQSLLDCLHPIEARGDLARKLLEDGFMEIALQVIKEDPTTEAAQNADNMMSLMLRTQFDLAISELIRLEGYKILQEHALAQSPDPVKVFDNQLCIPLVLVNDHCWEFFKGFFTERFFSTVTGFNLITELTILTRCVAACPSRREELLDLGFLTWIESLNIEMTDISESVVQLLADSLDFLARDAKIVASHAVRLRSAATHVLDYSTDEDSRIWLNTVQDLCNSIIDPAAAQEAEAPAVTKIQAHPTSVSPDIKIASDGLTCRVVEHSFHTFLAMPPQGYLKSGKWVYEVLVLGDGAMQVGWATADFQPRVLDNLGVGDDEFSWAIDYNRTVLWHKGIHPLSNHLIMNDETVLMWERGDVVLCTIDLDEKIMTFRLEDEEEIVAFRDFDVKDGVIPAITLARGQSVTMNFGQLPILRCDPNVYKNIDGAIWTKEQILDQARNRNIGRIHLTEFWDVLGTTSEDLDEDERMEYFLNQREQAEDDEDYQEDEHEDLTDDEWADSSDDEPEFDQPGQVFGQRFLRQQ